MLSRLFRIVAGFSILLAIAGCSSPSQESSKLPKQEPLVSIMITQGAFSGPVKAPTGWVFYVEQSLPPAQGAILRGYRLVEGKIRETTLSGSYTAKVIAAIEAIDFEPFDWDSEVAIAQKRLGETLQEGEGVGIPMTHDGAEFEIVINSKRGRFRMREWNPQPFIDFYAPYSEKIDKLKRVIDTLAVYMGRKQLGVGYY